MEVRDAVRPIYGSLGVKRLTSLNFSKYQGADKSLARPGRKQARKHFRDARDFITSRRELSSSSFSLQGNAPKEIHAILTETLAGFLPGRVTDSAAPLYRILHRKLQRVWLMRQRRHGVLSRNDAASFPTAYISRLSHLLVLLLLFYHIFVNNSLLEYDSVRVKCKKLEQIRALSQHAFGGLVRSCATHLEEK